MACLFFCRHKYVFIWFYSYMNVMNVCFNPMNCILLACSFVIVVVFVVATYHFDQFLCQLFHLLYFPCRKHHPLNCCLSFWMPDVLHSLTRRQNKLLNSFTETSFNMCCSVFLFFAFSVFVYFMFFFNFFIYLLLLLQLFLNLFCFALLQTTRFLALALALSLFLAFTFIFHLKSHSTHKQTFIL